MRTTMILSLVIAAVATPSLASAQQTTQLAAVVDNNNNTVQTVADAKPAPAVAAEKKICKRLQSSYSRSTPKVCLTKDEWAKVEADAQ
ncbi:MAG TPA: hypothetical protein VF027_02215 [Sphingomicrobium sp.]